MNQVRTYFPDIYVLSLQSMESRMVKSKGLDTANMLSLSDYFEEENPSLKPLSPNSMEYDNFANYKFQSITSQRYLETGNPNAKYTAVVFRDSFATNLIPYLSESFKKVVFIWSPFRHDIMGSIIKLFKPDIVIEEMTERLIGSYYQHHACYTILGKSLLDKGEPLLALQYFQHALRLSPASSESHYNVGYALIKSEKPLPAARYFKKALELDPDHKKARESLSAILETLFHQYAQRGDYRPAVSILKKLLALEPENLSTYYNLACMYSLLNMPEQSIKWLRAAIHKGYDNWALIKTDDDLANVRNTPEFKDMFNF